MQETEQTARNGRVELNLSKNAFARIANVGKLEKMLPKMRQRVKKHISSESGALEACWDGVTVGGRGGNEGRISS